ncbi:MAG TPA: gliding motility protein GldN [Cyclobacteriaceae bacterium]|nr:gliding motility protein GldN [Cyclobacteriaceae bacterium]HRJ80320.1 gliding motility protein GldN [Cyclobacteriaceae bacterium]
MTSTVKRVLFIVAFCSSMLAFAQPEEVQYNPNSLNPIPRYEQLYKLRVWRIMELNEKQNKGFFARNGEITKLLMDAVKSGEIPVIYKSDSLSEKSVLTKDEFLANLVSQQGQSFPAWDPTNTYYQADVVSFNGKNYELQVNTNRGTNPATSPAGEWLVTTQGQGLTFLPREITVINIAEDVIFDRRRSRLYYDIQAIEMQAFDQNTSTFKSLGWFKYKDVEKVFRNNPAKAVWFNRQNTAENKNFADAFLLRLFKGTIYKIENPDDDSIADVYRNNGRPYYESVWAREWAEMMLMEKEHNLWEF